MRCPIVGKFSSIESIEFFAKECIFLTIGDLAYLSYNKPIPPSTNIPPKYEVTG